MPSFIKRNKTYLLIGYFLLFVNTSLFWFNRTQTPPEFFYYIWLVGKGQVIYKDFFHNHGPLLYNMLAPFSSDKSLTWFKIFYTLVQTANLTLILLIIKKFSGIRGFVIGGITFIILNFYFSFNYFWDEQIIATFYLLIYYLICSKEFDLKAACIGILIGLASLIKINALIFVIPVLFFYKKKSFLFYLALTWLIAMIYFLLHNALLQFITNYVVFNFHYQNHLAETFPYLSVIKSHFILLNFLIVIFIFAIYTLNRKNISVRLMIFLLASTYCMYPLIGDDRFAPFTSFLAVFVAYLFTVSNKRFIFFAILCSYLLVYSYQAKNKIERLGWQPTAIENVRSQKIITYLNKSNLYSKNFYVMSNNIEIYYLLNKPYKLYHAEVYSGFSKYYEDFQKTDINDIKRNNMDLIIIPLPIDGNYSLANKLINFIKTNYSVSYKSNDFLVYSIKTK